MIILIFNVFFIPLSIGFQINYANLFDEALSKKYIIKNLIICKLY
jgi:hypothetical protein